MSLLKLFEANLKEALSAKKTVGFLPGRFQPFHSGHKKVYDELVALCGADSVYVLTSDDTSSFKSPFSFDQKRDIMTRLCGIPADKILKVKSPYSIPQELALDESTVGVFAVSAKDMTGDARFQFPEGSEAMRKDGTAKYLQKYPGSPSRCESIATHAYIMEVQVHAFVVDGKEIDSATELRQLLIGDEAQARTVFTDMYGTFDQEMFDMMRRQIESKVMALESYSMISEGGNVWKADMATSPINLADVKPTVQWLEKLTGLPLLNNMLGTTGRKQQSGDLDLGIDGSVSKAELSDKLRQWAIQNDPSAESKMSGASVHFRTPIRGDGKNGYVQTDFMFMPDLEFAKWAMAAPSSQYKAADRFVLLSSIAKSLGLKYSATNGLMSRTTGKLVDGGKDPDHIAKLLLGPVATKESLATFESIMKTLEKDSHRDERIADARETLAKKGIEI